MNRVAVCAGLFVSVFAIVTPSESQTTPRSAYFYADGRKIELRPSSRYAAIQLKSGTEVGPQSFGFDQQASAGNVNLLKESRIVLIKKGPMSFGGKPPGEFLKGQSQVQRVIPVYELDGADLIQPDQILVKVKAEDAREAVEARLRKLGRTQRERDGHYVVTVPRQSSLEIANGLATDPEIEFAEPNFVAILSPNPQTVGQGTSASGAPNPSPSVVATSPATSFPNDTYFGLQWALQNTGVKGKTGADIEALPAWAAIRANSKFKTQTMTIAIIDEGVDTKHPDLKDKVVKPYDATTKGKGSQDPNSWDNHGTACAGIAAAATNNNAGIAGLSLDARIMPIKIATTQKPQSPDEDHPWITTWDTIADGIETATDQGADVLSNSWGGGYSNVVNDAIDYALKKGRKGLGAVVVFAAGNDASSVSWPGSLSKKKTIITVSATNEWDEFKTKMSSDGESWWGSNFGPEVTVAAPGVHIYTTTIHANGGKPEDDFIGDFNGTSSATPLVAGLAALILSEHPDWTSKQVRDRIQSTADQLGAKPRNNQFGYGRINACKAVGGKCRN